MIGFQHMAWKAGARANLNSGKNAFIWLPSICATNRVIEAFEALQLEFSEFLDTDQDLEDYIAHFEQSFIKRLNADMIRR